LTGSEKRAHFTHTVFPQSEPAGLAIGFSFSKFNELCSRVGCIRGRLLLIRAPTSYLNAKILY